MFKLFSLVRRGVHFTKLLSLIADTFQYFHDQGIERGIFKEENPTK